VRAIFNFVGVESLHKQGGLVLSGQVHGHARYVPSSGVLCNDDFKGRL
jgi:hypothetical protein